MNFDWTQGDLAEGLRRYDAGEFFAAHEFWEIVWLAAPEPDKKFLQALIQVTAAFHHVQRKNYIGAERLLSAALRKLEPYPPSYASLSVAPLCDDICGTLQTLRSGEPPPKLVAPRIHPHP
jgi:predicted metal-dependent hydrolase